METLDSGLKAVENRNPASRQPPYSNRGNFVAKITDGVETCHVIIKINPPGNRDPESYRPDDNNLRKYNLKMSFHCTWKRILPFNSVSVLNSYPAWLQQQSIGL